VSIQSILQNIQTTISPASGLNQARTLMSPVAGLSHEATNALNTPASTLHSATSTSRNTVSSLKSDLSLLSSNSSPNPYSEEKKLSFEGNNSSAIESISVRKQSSIEQSIITNIGAPSNPLLLGGINTPNSSVNSSIGTVEAHWENVFIRAAMPILFAIEKFRFQTDNDFIRLKLSVISSLKDFSSYLHKMEVNAADINNSSYLLCTFIDEIFAEKVSATAVHSTSLSLLVEFHGDSWGGEDCFKHLESYLTESHKHQEILKFYYWILLFGMKGKFNLINRGLILLADLKNDLFKKITFKQINNLSITNAYLLEKQYWLTAAKVKLLGLITLVVLYIACALFLYNKGLILRQEIAAWEPVDYRPINDLMDTLPPPLPQLLAEGWLDAKKHPLGWLLIFRSDGAFETGKYEITPKFVNNIDRLGKAFAPWPGDLEVIGHTDNQPIKSGPIGSNQRLSELRAETVKDLLQKSAVPIDTGRFTRVLTSSGAGESEPVADNDTKENRTKNRRVDILWKIGKRN
jgi:type VI secretion system protein ImpK